MNIEVWLDFVCPFCYIGEKKLSIALEQTGLSDKAEIRYRSFQLDVNAKRDPSRDIHQMIADKYGMPYQQAKGMNDRIVQAAGEIGLNFDLDIIKPGNTALAHQMYKYAETLGKGQETTELLFQSHFEKGVDIGSEEELISLAGQVGIDGNDLRRVFSDTLFLEEVMKDQEKAMNMGITGVPFFIFNGKQTVSGAQSIEHFEKVLKEA